MLLNFAKHLLGNVFTKKSGHPGLDPGSLNRGKSILVREEYQHFA
jgi:hypothetical protein